MMDSSAISKNSWKEQAAEVSVFLFLIIPSMALSFLAIKQGSMNFVLVAISVILRDLALVSLILFLSSVTMSPLLGLDGHSKTAGKRSP